MGNVPRAFSKEGAVEVEAVAAALQPRFALAAGPEKAVSHTWLDTFDWRLHSAGISLEYVDGGPLILQLPDGSRLQAPLAGLKWPAQVHDLPAGLLRDSLAARHLSASPTNSGTICDGLSMTGRPAARSACFTSRAIC